MCRHCCWVLYLSQHFAHCCQQYLSKFDRRETQRYLQMFYHFKLRPLIQMVPRTKDEVSPPCVQASRLMLDHVRP
jgi:hypothetical protein